MTASPTTTLDKVTVRTNIFPLRDDREAPSHYFLPLLQGPSKLHWQSCICLVSSCAGHTFSSYYTKTLTKSRCSFGVHWRKPTPLCLLVRWVFGILTWYCLVFRGSAELKINEERKQGALNPLKHNDNLTLSVPELNFQFERIGNNSSCKWTQQNGSLQITH